MAAANLAKSCDGAADGAGGGPMDGVKLLAGGAQAFARMLAAIAAARESVYLEVYLFRTDATGRHFLDALVAARRRGVRVEVILDGWGSAADGRTIFAELAAAGCVVCIHNRLRAFLVGRFNRDHRKILLVDRRVAFIGGINIGNEYAWSEEEGGWADLAVELEGPVCERLACEIAGAPLPVSDGPVRVLLSRPWGGRRLRRRYLRAIRNARQRIALAQGYFLPDRQLLRAICAAAERGVEVTLLLAGRTDVAFTHLATRRLYRRLLTSGVRLFEWHRSVLHAKAAAIDGTKLLVGSFNVDPASLVMMEALVEADGAEAAQQVEAWIAGHVASARPLATTDLRRGGPLSWASESAGLLFERAGGFLNQRSRLMEAGATREDHRVDRRHAELLKDGVASPRWHHFALTGAVLATGAPAGWLFLRMLSGAAAQDGARAEIVAHAELYSYLLVSTLAVFTVFGALVGLLLDELSNSNTELRALAVTDALTGLGNARSFHARLTEESARAHRDTRPLVLVVADLDHFKAINDRLGHQAGDGLLARVADALRQHMRLVDLPFRIGGDELALLCPGTDAAEAQTLVDRIRLAFASLGATGSFGIAALETTPRDLFRRADAALYAAKRAGGDRIVAG